MDTTLTPVSITLVRVSATRPAFSENKSRISKGFDPKKKKENERKNYVDRRKLKMKKK